MHQSNLEEWLPLRGRWLAYFQQGIGMGLLLLVLLVFLMGLGSFMPVTLKRPPKGPVGDARTQIGNCKTALELYRIDHAGNIPTTRQGLLTLIYRPRFGVDPHWKGPYLDDMAGVLVDPWQHALVYQSPGAQGEEYEILSYGADGKPGGEGDDEDISSVRR
jgi:general secretion pathway protein G